VSKRVEPPARVSSIAMRAILTGFRFLLEDGILKALDSPEAAFEHAI
jgi:hypothetical protein